MSSHRISSANCCNWSSLSFLTCSGLSTMSRYRFISGERRIGVMDSWGNGEESGSSLQCPKTPMLRGDDGSLSNWGGLFRRGGVREAGRFKSEFARGVRFQFLDLQLGFSQLGLADFGQPCAFFEAGQKGLQRQFIGFHRLDNSFEFFQRLFKRQIFPTGCLGWSRFGLFRHKGEVKTTPAARLADCPKAEERRPRPRSVAAGGTNYPSGNGYRRSRAAACGADIAARCPDPDWLLRHHAADFPLLQPCFQ